ncbi:hypothetical protein RHGRI_005331 [Rhododendron griersonianum]|uniref:Major facilitator superfamily (MFS) profile domain-containing protein n=2 Tax=Rhododendron TaxID=4346 RepID=A0AAV6LE17_9ERIC|nr:hypothetical protein RHGRI_005331 [Rhododendron griersonianum]KAG5562563.1 hypothetical protein RHGRI_005331 [Rhododendron griersonianum]
MGDEDQNYSLDEALVAVGFGKFQFFVLLYAGMGLVSEAMEMMLLSFIGPAVQAAWGLSSHEESLLTTVVFAGMLVGTYTSGIVSDNFGRSYMPCYKQLLLCLLVDIPSPHSSIDVILALVEIHSFAPLP